MGAARVNGAHSTEATSGMGTLAQPARQGQMVRPRRPAITSLWGPAPQCTVPITASLDSKPGVRQSVCVRELSSPSLFLGVVILQQELLSNAIFSP